MNSGCSETELSFDEDGIAMVDGRPVAPKEDPEGFWDNIDKWKDLIGEYSVKNGVPPAWIAAVMAQESRGRPGAGSGAGAQGLMQIMPVAFKHFMGRAPVAGEMTDPRTNIDVGSMALAYHYKRYDNNWLRMLAGYNRGHAGCGTGKGCKPDRWNLVTNCGYIDGALGFYNYAVEQGYPTVPSQMDGVDVTPVSYESEPAQASVFASPWFWLSGAMTAALLFVRDNMGRKR